MDDEIKIQKYRKLSLTSLITGILSVSFCILYFTLWALFDDFLTGVVADHKFISYIMFIYVCAGIGLAITAVITGRIDLSRIKTGAYIKKGKGFDIAGIILGSFLIMFGFILWFVDFFGFINIINWRFESIIDIKKSSDIIITLSL